jgi:hypothetical protein
MEGSEDRNAREAYVRELRAQAGQLAAKLEKVSRLLAIIEEADPLEASVVGMPRPAASDAVRHNFRGRTYRQAIYVLLRERPMTNPELADALTAGGIDSDRKKAKMNVDALMKRLRATGAASKGLDGRWILKEAPALVARLLP